MITERFEERLMDELKNHVQQRARGAHTGQAAVGRARRGGRLDWLPVGLASALAAVAASVVVTALPIQTAAAYTLQSEKSGVVKLAIVNPAGKIDLNKLHMDLDRLGIRNRVVAGEPCQVKTLPVSPNRKAGVPSPRSVSVAPVHAVHAPTNWPLPFQLRGADGKPILYIRSGRPVLYISSNAIPADDQLVIGFPLAKTDLAHAYAVMDLIFTSQCSAVPVEP